MTLKEKLQKEETTMTHNSVETKREKEKSRERKITKGDKTIGYFIAVMLEKLYGETDRLRKLRRRQDEDR